MGCGNSTQAGGGGRRGQLPLVGSGDVLGPPGEAPNSFYELQLSGDGVYAMKLQVKLIGNFRGQFFPEDGTQLYSGRIELL